MPEEETRLGKILPSSFELVAFIFVTILVIILGNSHQLLTYYGLESSNQVIGHSAGTAVSAGLGQLDNFKFTDAIVTFLIWALVGVFCFSVVRALATAFHEVEMDAEMSSNRYIHPSNFKKAVFWKQVAFDFVVLTASLSLLGGLLYGFMGFIMPTALAYTRTFLIGTPLSGIGALLLGMAIVYVWLVFMDMCLRIVLHHRRITQVS